MTHDVWETLLAVRTKPKQELAGCTLNRCWCFEIMSEHLDWIGPNNKDCLSTSTSKNRDRCEVGSDFEKWQEWTESRAQRFGLKLPLD